MAIHMSLRLAWHDNGWNGHICRKPEENFYCIGQHSYPPQSRISKTRNLEIECQHAGQSCINKQNSSCIAACGLSINAFGRETITVTETPPDFFHVQDPQKSAVNISLPPATACTWCYGYMFSDNTDNLNSENGIENNKRKKNAQRKKNAEDYFSKFTPNESLIFYYSGYSNPFSENEEMNYVVVGVSRLKALGPFSFYNNLSDNIRAEYANGLVWQKPITSNYPNEGFCLPLWKYKDNKEILNKLVIKPINKVPFKYDCREVSNDDAIELIYSFLNAIDILIENHDTTEDWYQRKLWLNKCLNELWKARGPYPGLPFVLEILGLTELIQDFTKLTNFQEMKDFYLEIKNFLENKQKNLSCVQTNTLLLEKVKRNFSLYDDAAQKLLIDIFPRFEISTAQMKAILDENRIQASITSSLNDIYHNPYIIFEEYQGINYEDVIPFYKIDNGILPSPDYGLEQLLSSDSPERLRALCVDELNHIASHSFCKALIILETINQRLDNMQNWKKHHYVLKNFDVDAEILEKAIHIRKDNDNNFYLYLKNVYDDELLIGNTFNNLVNRQDIQSKITILEKDFLSQLKDETSPLNLLKASDYQKILNDQAKICMQIFPKSLCVLSGPAGTGKTTIIKALIHYIKANHGAETKCLFLAPTGKAAERIKQLTNEKSPTTIHSFLALNNWLGNNYTIKRNGGEQSKEYDTIIIDECSMIDTKLFAALFRAINWHKVKRLILVGDPNQIPPIGRGKVFSEVINWLKQEHPQNIGILSGNIRQLLNNVENKGNGILDLANIFIQEQQKSSNDSSSIYQLKSKKEKIIETILDNGDGDIDNDLAVYFWQNNEDLSNRIKEIIINDLTRIAGSYKEDKNYHQLWLNAINYGYDNCQPERIQIITPYRGEYYGTESLNHLMQEIVNPIWSKKTNIDGISYYDKVIQIKNRPKSDKAYTYNHTVCKFERNEVFNGEIGIVWPHAFDLDEKTKNISKISNSRIQVVFANRNNLKFNYGKNLSSRKIEVPDQDISDNLELAYAISVHKSQGSEFDYVYIIIPKRDSHLLSMELLYTAITRAKTKVTLFIQDDITTLISLSRLEKSAIRHINSSVFTFKPLPDALLSSKEWHEDTRKYATLSDYLVRSKSEVIITNLLVEENIPFEYEKPLFSPDGNMYLPDFTVTLQGETYYWEHVGRLDIPEYKEHWGKKKEWYDKYFPGKLLTTFEGNDLTLQAKNIINNFGIN